MSGKVMKKLRKLAYRDRPIDPDQRQYTVRRYEKKIEIPAKTPDGKINTVIKRSATLLCADDRVSYKDLKKDYRRE